MPHGDAKTMMWLVVALVAVFVVVAWFVLDAVYLWGYAAALKELAEAEEARAHWSSGGGGDITWQEALDRDRPRPSEPVLSQNEPLSLDKRRGNTRNGNTSGHEGINEED